MNDKKYDEDDIQRLGGVIAEDLASQFKAGFEAIDEIKKQVAKIPAIEATVIDLQSDMKVVKAAVTANSKDRRLTQVEARI